MRLLAWSNEKICSDYKTDDSVKEMSIYLMEVDDNGKWVKKEIAKETILPKERTF